MAGVSARHPSDQSISQHGALTFKGEHDSSTELKHSHSELLFICKAHNVNVRFSVGRIVLENSGPFSVWTFNTDLNGKIIT